MAHRSRFAHMNEPLQRELERRIEGEVRFDAVSRALYSTDASVYQIHPLGVVVPANRDDILRTLEICRRLRFAPDITTASRATIGGMMANNSSGARSVLYGKTIDHVLEQVV